MNNIFSLPTIERHGFIYLHNPLLMEEKILIIIISILGAYLGFGLLKEIIKYIISALKGQ